VKVRPLLREAVLNVYSDWLRSLAVVAIAAAAIGALAFLELRQANELVAFQDDFTAAGGHVSVVSSQGGGVSAARCEALREWPGVIAAGSTRSTGTVDFATAPGTLFQSAALSEGLLAVWSPALAGTGAVAGGYIVGPALAEELGLQTGSYTALSGEPPVRIDAVLDVARRNPVAARWLLDIVPPAGAAESCWVEFTRAGQPGGDAALAAWFAQGDGEPIVRRYLQAGEFARDPLAEFRSRPQRFGWIAVGGLIAAVFLLLTWFRRAELALYLALGVTRSQLRALLALEAAMILVAAGMLGLGYAFAVHAALERPLPLEHVQLGLSAGLSAMLLGLALAPWLGAAAVRGNIASLLKDR
jgi:hypothetical protein